LSTRSTKHRWQNFIGGTGPNKAWRGGERIHKLVERFGLSSDSGVVRERPLIREA